MPRTGCGAFYLLIIYLLIYRPYHGISINMAYAVINFQLKFMHFHMSYRSAFFYMAYSAIIFQQNSCIFIGHLRSKLSV